MTTSTTVNDSAAVEQSARVDVVVLRLVNLGGALVTVTKLAKPIYTSSGTYWHLWRCLGCGAHERVAYFRCATGKGPREHAAWCRSLPPSPEEAAPPSAGQVLVAEAIQEMTRVLGEQIAELRDELCTEVAEVAARRGRRRWWLGRGVRAAADRARVEGVSA
jgi:hypothetical protein